MLVLLPIPNALDYFITMCHAYASTIFLRASCHEEMHVGAVVALSPRHIITFHRIRNQQWSRRAAFAAFAMPAAGTGHVCTRPVSPCMIGTQYPSSQYDDNDTNPVSRHLPVTAARSCAQSIARQPESSFQWRSRATGLALRLLCGTVALNRLIFSKRSKISTMSECRLEVLEHLLWCAVALRGSHLKLREVVS